MALAWIGRHFSEYWVSEADVAFARHPATVFLAHRGDELLGFACYDTTRKNFFGPTGVHEAERGRGMGRALLLAALHDMRAAGYMYGIIGWAGPVAYYEKAVGASVIPGTEPPGSYRGMLGHRRHLQRGGRRLAPSWTPIESARCQAPPGLIDHGIDELGQAAAFAHGYALAEEGEDHIAIDGSHLFKGARRCKLDRGWRSWLWLTNPAD